MADIRSLSETIRDLDNRSRDASRSLDQLRGDLAEIQRLKASTSLISPEEFAQLSEMEERLSRIITLEERRGKISEAASKRATEANERARRSLEGMISTHRILSEQLGKLTKQVPLIADAYAAVKKAASDLGKADVGGLIQSVTSAIPVVRWLGLVVGTAVTATTKMQDQVQLLNRTIINSQAAVGRFGQGMEMARKNTIAVRAELAKFGTTMGINTKDLHGYIDALGKTGFSLEEMGIDEHTGKVKTLSDAISDLSGQYGTLATSISMSRMAGLDMGVTVDQMGFQMKTMGDASDKVVNTFAALTVAASRSKLSTSMLLPILRGVQDQFKYVGLDSSKAATALGLAADAARKAGLGPGVGAQLMGRAMGGLMQAPMGIQAFLGQRMGMGPGLAAGFAFAQQLGRGGRGLEMVRGTVGTVQQAFGGKVSLADASVNDVAAAMRTGQEQFLSQLLNVSTLEARAIIEMQDHLSELEKSGAGASDEAEATRRKLEEATKSEKDYAAETLTVQQKMETWLELISSLIGRIGLAFIRGFAGRAAESAGLGTAFSDLMKAIQGGKGVDVAMAAMSTKLEQVTPAIEEKMRSFGEWLGKGVGILSYFWKEISALLAGVMIFKGVRGIQGMMQAGRQATELTALTKELAALRFGGGKAFGPGVLKEIAEAAKDAAPALEGVAKEAGIFSKILGPVGRGLGGLVGGLGRAGAAALPWIGGAAAAAGVGYAIGTVIRAGMDWVGLGKELDNATNSLGSLVGLWDDLSKVTSEVANSNRQLLRINKEAAEREQLVGISTARARGMMGLDPSFKGKSFYGTATSVEAFKKMSESEKALMVDAIRGGMKEFGFTPEQIEAKTAEMFGKGTKPLALEINKLWQVMHEMLPGIYKQETWEEAKTDPGAISVVNSLMTTLQRVGELKQAGALWTPMSPMAGVQDAWGINRGGWMPVSQGDVVVDARSLASYMKGGAGDALRIGGDVFRDARPAVAPAGGGGVREHDVIFRVRAVSPELGVIIDERIAYNVERDIVMPGKSGVSQLAKGSSYRGY